MFLEFFYYDLLYTPMYNLLLFFYSLSGFIIRESGIPMPEMGLAIILMTVFVRVLLLPLSIRSARSEQKMEAIQPQIDELKNKYRYNIEKQRTETKRILRENNIGIYSNVMGVFVQVLFLVVLYEVFSSGLQVGGHNHIYTFNWRVSGINYASLNPSLFGLFDLTVSSQAASLFAAFMVFFQQGIRKVKHFSDSTSIEKALLIGLPIGTYIAAIILPASKAVFVAVSVIFSLWLRFLRWIIRSLVVKDEDARERFDNVWTN